MIEKKLTYSFYYFSLGSVIAVIVGFFPVYCDYLGFSHFEIALITLAEDISKVIGSMAGLAFCRKLISSRKYFALSGFIVLALATCLFWTASFWGIVLVWFLFLFAYHSQIALIAAAAIKDSVVLKLNYGRVRLWGSVAFIIATLVAGPVIDFFSILAFVPIIVLLISFNFLVSVFGRKTFPNKLDEEVNGGHVFSELRAKDAKGLRSLLITVFFQWASAAAFYAYFSLYLKQISWTASEISVAWAVAVIVEVILFLFYDQLATKISWLSLMRISIIFTALRWLILATIGHYHVILFSQVLHSFTYGAFQLSAMKYAFRVAPSSLRDRSQGLLMAFGAGLGVAFGRLTSGCLTTIFEEGMLLNNVFYASAVFSFVAYLFSQKLKPVEQN